MLNGLGAFSMPGRWFKGNLHCHVVRGEGLFDWKGAVERYKEIGYHFLAMTDHGTHFLPADHRMRLHDFARAHDDGEFVVFPGAEIHPERQTLRSPRRYHLIVPRLPEDLSIERTNGPLADALDELASRNAPFYVAHPYWSGNDLLDLLPVAAPALGIEVFNSYCSSIGRGVSSVHWDELLTRGFPLAGIAADDAHGDRYVGRAWTVVKAPELGAEAIMKALVDGSFYSSTGPVIEDFSFDAGVFSVRTEPVQAISFVAPPRMGSVACADPGKTITEAQWEIPDPFDGYVRVECYLDSRRAAWTNPVFFKDRTPVE